MSKKPDIDGMLDKLQDLREKEDPLRKPIRKIFDADIDSPDIFFMMDEKGKKQILRKFDKSTGERRYAGTYEILYKTDDRDKFYLIMTRMNDESEVAEDLKPVADEQDTWIVCSYTPGVKGRIYLQGLAEETINRITSEYAKKLK